MSRIGKKPVKLESGVSATLTGRQVTVTGPKGKLSYALPEGIALAQEAGQLTLSAGDDSRQGKMFLGLARSLLQGMVVGVTAGYKKELQIEGVGFGHLDQFGCVFQRPGRCDECIHVLLQTGLFAPQCHRMAAIGPEIGIGTDFFNLGNPAQLAFEVKDTSRERRSSHSVR